MSRQKKYNSFYGAFNKLTTAQKLAEVACERIARKDGKILPTHFWKSPPEWSKEFFSQLRFANSLLKVFDEEVVLQAFMDRAHIWTLGAPFFRKIVEEEQKKYDQLCQRVAKSLPITTSSTETLPTIGVPSTGSARAKLNKLRINEKSGKESKADN